MATIIENIDALRIRKRAYHTTFQSPIGQDVLKDLAKFCRGWETCFNKDPRVHAVLEGRREVWLRICEHLHLDVDQLYKLYQGQTIQLQEEE